MPKLETVLQDHCRHFSLVVNLLSSEGATAATTADCQTARVTLIPALMQEQH